MGHIFSLTKGRYRLRLAVSGLDFEKALRLRALVFRKSQDGETGDGDDFDTRCQHVLIEDLQGERLFCCYRFLMLPTADAAELSYSAQFYDLSALSHFTGPLMELGRFCLHPDCDDPDVVRLAWAALTQVVDAKRVQMLFGCSSFTGADPALHAPALAYLARHHLAPANLAPKTRRLQSIALAGLTGEASYTAVPALLRSYLGMGAWVSDHAVIDDDLDTLHVLTGVEIAKIPASRARALRLLAQSPLTTA